MKRPLLITSLALTGMLLAGCTALGTSASTGADDTGASASASATSAAEPTAFEGDLSPDEVLSANADYTTVQPDEWSMNDAVDVELSGSAASSSVGEGVDLDGTTVTIAEAGVYRLSGSFDGRVVVAAPEDALVVLVLDGADITNSAGPAIEVQSADDVAIHLAEGSENSVSDAVAYTDDAGANAAIYADSDLTVSGEGSLSVTGNGNDGITSTDDLVILAGGIDVTAADDALRGKDALVIEGGDVQLTATAGDALKSDQSDDETQGYILVSGGTIDLTAGDDGLQAHTDTVITGGTITAAVADDGVKAENIVSIGGGSLALTASTEGVEAINIAIGAGSLDITAADDGVNASGLNTGGQDRESDTGERLEISGGTITIEAAFDGLDSNGSITISGGELDITSAANGGDAPIDANGEASITGGTIMANGAEYDPSTANAGPGGGMGRPQGERPEGAPDGSLPQP